MTLYDDKIELDRLKLQNASSKTLPFSISIGNSIFTPTALGNGVVRYTLSIAVTGSAQNLQCAVPKPHRLVRLEYQQVVTATGSLDATGLACEIQRQNQIQAAGSAGVANVTLAEVPNTADDTIIFVFGEGWEADRTIYNFAFTGQNLDTLTIDLYLQYL